MKRILALLLAALLLCALAACGKRDVTPKPAQDAPQVEKP